MSLVTLPRLFMLLSVTTCLCLGNLSGSESLDCSPPNDLSDDNAQPAAFHLTRIHKLGPIIPPSSKNSHLNHDNRTAGTKNPLPRILHIAALVIATTTDRKQNILSAATAP
ncbi:hypothetical protein V496_05751 [Pseudogymnoascus sp. VKM F-4515 (FW-2607)]|nr:hypothetical protein V496_05751 [Pseudogymnoascus sp. VKM F-4515 (FW-2607)]